MLVMYLKNKYDQKIYMNISNYIKRVLLLMFIGVLILPQGMNAADLRVATTIDQNLKSIVYIACGNVENGENVFYSTGSGVVLADGLVITNAHVVSYDGDPENWYYYDFCVGGISEYSYLAPDVDMFFVPNELFFSRTEYFDYSLMSAYDLNGDPYVFKEVTTYGNPDSLIHGDEITLIGYPTNSGETITLTSGAVSGFEYGNWIKTDAIAEFGNSGGGAFDVNGNLIGIPTAVSTGDLNSITYIANINAIFEDMFGEYVMVRDYNNLYTRDNIACFDNSCYHFGEGVDDIIASQNLGVTPEEIVKIDEKVLDPEPESSSYDPELKDQKIIDRMQGNILLQVEQHGEA